MLDPESRRGLWDYLGQARARQGTTIVLTTHYLEEADELADRVVVIDRGVVVADAQPGVIKSRVAGKRVSFDSNAPLTDADFHGMPYRRLELRGGHVRLLSNEPEAILGALFRHGVEIRNLEVVGADLEEAFIALTSHEPVVDEQPAEAEEVAG